MKPHVLKCVTCGRTFDPGTGAGTCPSCGDIEGTLDVVLEHPGISPEDLSDRGNGILDLHPLLPLDPDAPWTRLRIGSTPLYACDELAALLGVASLWIKDDGLNPSASLKDRATAVALAAAASQGRRVVAAASTGNAASSLAVVAASMGLKAVIFVPRAAPEPKVAQMLLAGASVVRVHGTYDQAFDLCAQAVAAFGWYSRNTATNPYLAEGKKTCAIEIARSMGFAVPDMVAVGVGDGCVFGALYKGFKELYEAGVTGSIPKLIGVQAAGCAPLARAFERGLATAPPLVEPDTYADSIAVGKPRDQVKALRAARESGGVILAVPDDRIREAARILASRAGVLAEPAGAAGFAGLLELRDRGKLHGDARAVAVVSGHALKDTDGAMSAVTSRPFDVPAGPKGFESLKSMIASI